MLKFLELNQCTSSVLKLYHGSHLSVIRPTFGLGDDRHDYGRGFYLTPDKELAKEWAVSKMRATAWVHAYTLDVTNLSVFDFESIVKHRGLIWVTELLRHRVPRNKSPLFDNYMEFLINCFGYDLSDYDVIRGWRADDSYFRIAESLMNNTLSVSLLDEALRLGDLGVQFFIKTEMAFQRLQSLGPSESVDLSIYRQKYLERDRSGRRSIQELLYSERNKQLLRDFTIDRLYWTWYNDRR